VPSARELAASTLADLVGVVTGALSGWENQTGAAHVPKRPAGVNQDLALRMRKTPNREVSMHSAAMMMTTKPSIR
jgi:hypothetical protein